MENIATGVTEPPANNFILFKSDWDRFPSAIPQKNTRNPHFIEFSKKLKYMGVDNCLWPLALMNPDLDGVDPHDEENLSQEEKLLIGYEAFINPWYYLREVLLIPPATGTGGNLFRANRGNMSMLWSYMNHVDYLLIQPRQTGKTISSFALYSWLLYFRYRNTRIGLVTKSDELRADNARLLRAVKDYLPTFLIVNDGKDSINDSMVTYNVRGNRFIIAVSRSDPQGAYKVGRGNTMPTTGWDEVPYIPHIKIAYSAAMASGDAVIEEAKSKGIPYGSIMTTTAGKQDDRDGSFVYKMWREAAKWTERFYDAATRIDFVQMVKDNMTGRKILINGTWNHVQMGVSDAKHYENIAKNAVEGDDANRDYFNVWTIGGASNPIDVKVLERIDSSKRSTVYDEVVRGFVIRWYVSKSELDNMMDPIIAGADTSEGGGSDALSVVFTHAYTGEVLGVSSVNLVLIPRYGDFLADVMIKYSNIIINPERKSTGQTFIDTLCIRLHEAGIDPFKRIFNHVVNDRSIEPAAFEEIRYGFSSRDDGFYARRKKQFGFCTGTTTRRTLYGEILKLGSKKVADVIRDEQLIFEIKGLQERNGRIDHPIKGNDDTVIAWLLTLWMLVYGNNLDYYGIDARKVLSRTIDTSASEEEITELEAIESLMNEFDTYLEKLKNTTHPILVKKFEIRLKSIAEELETLGGEPINVAARIDDIRNDSRKFY